MNDIFKNVIETITEGVIVIDNNFKFIYTNNAVKTVGLNNEATIGKSIFEVFLNIKKEDSTFNKVMQTKKPIIKQQQTFITYRGERKTTLTSTYPILKNNIVVGAYEIFQDISTLEEIRNQLQKMQAQQNKHINLDKDILNKNIDFIGESPEILKLKSEIPMVANSPSHIFLYGETGTGKEIYVEALHNAKNQETPLIIQNCAAIPENLLESYFFGTAEGSFTGAVNRKGLFELAHEGVLFLDEINSLPIDLQAKLLRVIQEQKVKRVGSTEELSIKVRIIAASNIPPRELLQNQELRKDLYYRLSILNINLPPLRLRRNDIYLLVTKFIENYNVFFNKNILGITQDAYNKLYQYDWPGNIRELKNGIERLMNIKKSGYIDGNDIDTHNILEDIKMINENFSNSANVYYPLKSYKELMDETEIGIIKNALSHTDGNISKASRQLDIPQQSLSNKVKKHQLRKYILEIKLLKNE